MKKKTMLVIFILCLLMCNFLSIYFMYRKNQREIEQNKKEIKQEETYQETLKHDNVPPVLILKKDKITVYQDEEINYLSFIKSATDNLEGDLITKVKYDKVNTKKTGEYTIEYVVEDSAFNITKAKLKVIVKNKPNYKYE